MAINEEITLKKLEVFLSFMELNNLARVADALGQSTVSVHRALHSLEDGLRCPLFKREGRSLIPLHAAYTFAESARRALTGVTLTTFKDLSWNGPFYAQAGFRTLEVHETGAALASILSAEKSAGMCLRIAMMRRNTVQPVHAADQIP